jgi:hypothetical protein
MTMLEIVNDRLHIGGAQHGRGQPERSLLRTGRCALDGVLPLPADRTTSRTKH